MDKVTMTTTDMAITTDTTITDTEVGEDQDTTADHTDLVDGVL